MIILLHGPDTYRSRQRLKTLREAFVAKHDPSGFNVVIIEGARASAEEVSKSLGAQGFFAKKRFIAIENISRAKSPKVLEVITQRLSQLKDPDLIAVFLEEPTEGKGRKKSLASLLGLRASSSVLIEQFPRLEGEELSQWLASETTKRQGRWEPAAAKRLLDICGHDLWQLSSELDKLISYANGRPITVADIELFVRGSVDTDIFKLTDAFASRRRAEALRLIDNEISSGQSVLYLVAMLTRQMRILIQVKDYLASGGNARSAATELGLHPYVTTKAVQQSAHFTVAQLQHIYRRLTQLDQRTKASSLDPRILLDVCTVDALT